MEEPQPVRQGVPSSAKDAETPRPASWGDARCRRLRQEYAISRATGEVEARQAAPPVHQSTCR